MKLEDTLSAIHGGTRPTSLATIFAACAKQIALQARTSPELVHALARAMDENLDAELQNTFLMVMADWNLGLI